MRPWTIIFAIIATTTAWAQPVMPPYNAEDDFHARFGNNRNVALVAALLAEKDFTIRENAVMDLGDMGNFTAIPHIRRMADDAHPLVRAAVALAAAKYPADLAGDIVTALLADKDPTVALSALRGVRMAKLESAATAVAKLLASDRPAIQANALVTLTALGCPPNAGHHKTETVEALLDSPSAVVRQRAIENMMLWDTSNSGSLATGVPPRDKLLALAKAGPSSLRATALAALGKYHYGGSEDLLRLTADDIDPQIRLGTLQGLANAGRADAIAPFLADRSEMVRLAAIRAAGELKPVDTVDVLFTLMLAAPLNELEEVDTRLAARDSLIAIATDAVADRAAREFLALVPQYKKLRADIEAAQAAMAAASNSGDKAAVQAKRADVARISAQDRMTSRNIRACARILGALKCKTVLDQQIALLAGEPTDSPVLDDLAWSLGELGDAKALPVLETCMTKCVEKAPEYLRARLAPIPSYVPYSSEGTAQCLAALVKLNSSQWLTHAHALATMKVSQLRLDHPVDEALAAYATRYADASDDEKAQMAADVAEIIADTSHRRLPRAVSTRLASEWKLPAAVAPLTKLLTDERPSRAMMQLAAWALHQIDGKERTVGDPVVTAGSWVVLEK